MSLLEQPEAVVLQQLTDPPESLSETFYPATQASIDIKDELISRIGINAIPGKSHAQLFVTYLNTSDAILTPAYSLRLYNPYGILMSWVRVPQDPSAPRQFMPSSNGTEVLKPRVMRLDHFFRHSSLEQYPDDFFSIGWLSVDADHQRAIKTPPAEARNGLMQAR